MRVNRGGGRRLLEVLVLTGAAAAAVAGGSMKTSAQQDDTKAGEAAFNRVCESCHGEQAKGNVGPSLVPFSREYKEVLGIVREGLGQMPPIAASDLSDEEVRQVVEYLKSL